MLRIAHDVALDPFDGTNDPFDGTNDPFDGTNDPFDGTNDPRPCPELVHPGEHCRHERSP